MTNNQLANRKEVLAGSQRLHYMDGLRGIAILLVILFHAYSDWLDLLPYGNQYDYIPIFHYGYLGVQLFFMLSGFVIAMTLDKCKTVWEFFYRRWLRLFPAMLVASVLTYVTASFFVARPYGQPALLDYLPGLLFIEPEFFRTVFGYHQKVAEGVVWTLFVEMKFYLVAGILYFTFGRKVMINTLIIMFLSSIVVEFLVPHLAPAQAEQLDTLYHYLNYRHYGWFAAGALFYQFYLTRNAHYWLGGLLVAMIAARCMGGLLSGTMVVATALVLLFAYAVKSPALQKMLACKPLIFLGFISYPLYLVHEQDMVSMIIQLHQTFALWPPYLLPILPILMVTFFAWIIAQYLEPATRRAIKSLLQFLNHKRLSLNQP